MIIAESPAIYILYENPEWLAPLTAALDSTDVPYVKWNLAEDNFDLTSTPPDGIFYSKMSASAHTRGHLHATDLAAAVLSWLEAHECRVINGYNVLQLEIKKSEQYVALSKAGLKVPKTLVANSTETMRVASIQMGFPVIIKPNRGGKGIGVKLLWSQEDLDEFLKVTDYSEFTVDGITLIQEYVQSSNQQITRMEFIDGRLYYAVNVDTQGGFELCPADGCSIEDIACAIDGQSDGIPRFSIIQNFDIPEIKFLERLLSDNNIEVAGIEFIQNEKGERYFYDINTNTNYNTDAEELAGPDVSGIVRVAKFLKSEFLIKYPLVHS